MAHSLVGWQLGRFDDIEWSPWGSGGNARAKVLADADGFFLALVEADPGYTGDAYGASPGSTHTDFVTETGATYVSIFKI